MALTAPGELKEKVRESLLHWSSNSFEHTSQDQIGEKYSHLTKTQTYSCIGSSDGAVQNSDILSRIGSSAGVPQCLLSAAVSFTSFLADMWYCRCLAMMFEVSFGTVHP